MLAVVENQEHSTIPDDLQDRRHDAFRRLFADTTTRATACETSCSSVMAARSTNPTPSS
jgi:hypothetical protein